MTIGYTRTETSSPITEYGNVTDENRSRRTILEDCVGSDGRRYALVHRTPGYECAGSMARWTNESWAVETWIDGTRHGQRFKNESEARALFDRWSTNAKGAKR